MKLYIVFGILTVYISVPTHGALPSNKVKVTAYELITSDSQFFDVSHSKAEVHRVNETYNRLAFHLEVLKDVPSDVEMFIEIRQSKTKQGFYTQVANYTVHPCDKYDKLRKYLPNMVISMTDSGKCLQKGKYSSDDSGIFKYYDLLPSKYIDGYYFVTVKLLKLSDGQTINLSVMRSQSITAK